MSRRRGAGVLSTAGPPAGDPFLDAQRGGGRPNGPGVDRKKFKIRDYWSQDIEINRGNGWR